MSSHRFRSIWKNKKSQNHRRRVISARVHLLRVRRSSTVHEMNLSRNGSLAQLEYQQLVAIGGQFRCAVSTEYYPHWHHRESSVDGRLHRPWPGTQNHRPSPKHNWRDVVWQCILPQSRGSFPNPKSTALDPRAPAHFSVRSTGERPESSNDKTQLDMPRWMAHLDQPSEQRPSHRTRKRNDTLGHHNGSPEVEVQKAMRIPTAHYSDRYLEQQK